MQQQRQSRRHDVHEHALHTEHYHPTTPQAAPSPESAAVQARHAAGPARRRPERLLLGQVAASGMRSEAGIGSLASASPRTATPTTEDRALVDALHAHSARNASAQQLANSSRHDELLSNPSTDTQTQTTAAHYYMRVGGMPRLETITRLPNYDAIVADVHGRFESDVDHPRATANGRANKALLLHWIKVTRQGFSQLVTSCVLKRSDLHLVDSLQSVSRGLGKLEDQLDGTDQAYTYVSGTVPSQLPSFHYVGRAGVLLRQNVNVVTQSLTSNEQHDLTTSVAVWANLCSVAILTASQDRVAPSSDVRRCANVVRQAMSRLSSS